MKGEVRHGDRDEGEAALRRIVLLLLLSFSPGLPCLGGGGDGSPLPVTAVLLPIRRTPPLPLPPPPPPP